jgi:DNA-binding PadR family transcriptional regulator
MSLYEDPTIARLVGLVLKVLEKGPASTAQLHRAIVTEFDNVPALSQSQILRLLHEMERSGSVRSSEASQTHLVWELAPRSK